MKITAIDTFAVRTDAIHPWMFCAIRTDEGLTGYSEFGDGQQPRGLLGLVEDMSEGLIGQDPGPVERIYVDLYRRTRHMSGGPVAMAIAGIELALWDLKGKALGVPVCALVGGPYREQQQVYWSHLATYRSHLPEFFGGKQLDGVEGIAACAAEAKEKGFRAFKTNILFPGGDPPSLMQGFVGSDDQNAPTDLIRHATRQIAAMREAVGPDIDIALDINYHFKTSGAIRMARAMEPYDLMWIEHDCQDARSLAQLKSSTTTPVCSGEQLVGVRQYLPFLERRAMDVVKIDVQWQGFSQAKKVADLAEIYEMNIAPHNYNSHLSSCQSVQLAASVSNVRLLELDVDPVPPWRDEITTSAPELEADVMTVPTAPGWGCDLDEAAAQRYRWEG